MTTVNTHSQFIRRRFTALIRRDRWVGQKRHESMFQTDLSIHHCDESAVPSMAVEEDQFSTACSCDAAPDVVEHRLHRVRRHPHSARAPRMLVAFRECERGKKPHVEPAFCAPSHRLFRNSIGDDEVSCEWQMRSMLFDCTERLQNNRRLTDSTLELDGGKMRYISGDRHIPKSTADVLS